MYKDHRIAVVIPAFNEEPFVAGVVRTVPAFVDQIFVVDDCSTDGTRDAVASACDERTELLSTPSNSGVGATTMVGYRAALHQGADIVVKMDADGQMDPAHLPALLDAIVEDGYDYAKGNRFLNHEALPEMPRHRLLGNVASTFMTKMATGYWNVFDPQNGYTAIRADVLKRLNFSAIHARFFFENDMLVQLSLHDGRVRDVPIDARYGDEISSLKPSQVLVSFPPLLFHRFWRRIWHNYVLRDFNPIALFLFLGLSLLAWGAGFGIYAWIRGAVTDEFASTGTVMLSVLPLVLGFQLVLQAIVLDIQHAPK